MNTRDILAALQAKTITPAEAKEAIAALGRTPPPAAAEPARTSTLTCAQLEYELATSLAEALYVGREGLDVSRPFSELGLDSIIGVEWVRILNKRYALSIPATRLYDYATVRTLTGYIAGELGVDVALPSSAGEVPMETPAVVASHDATDGQALHAELAESLAGALYVGAGDIGLDTPFAELGLDSIIGVEWVRTINKRYRIALAATRVYDYPTIRTLAGYLAAELGPRAPRVAPVPSLVHVEDGPHPPFGHLLPERERIALRDEPVAIELNASKADDGIAIIGMSGQFPGAANLEELWANLAAGRDCISEVPAGRWAVERFFDADPAAPGKTYSKWMGVLEDADKFDPMFFNLSPAEAEWMDPQQRLFLEASWHAVEEAGINPATLSGQRCGVFAGCAPGDYGSAFGQDGLTPEALMGLSLSMLAARIAYFLNLKGPCLAIETACSSSLVAVAQACDSLLLGESDLALAGGVCVLAGPRMHIMTSKAGMLSKEGRCFTFDERADGFVPGEGVGVLLLKRLSDAERDGDRIAGVLRGWGVNQDGKTNGITAPSMNSQVRLEKGVYERFGIDPRSISLMEAHGTGTRLGDPIEVEALSDAFGSYGDRPNRCAIGSVKSNIGHL
ncbi:MAG: Polyketide synthase, partial [Acidobacteria bacterium]|nr:Polyketide synthase [Acidobacteriota bacterium]